ncbi:MAG TPA: hypothetical protein VGP41_02430, partial [Candidatus Lustribacter sp.]|nr:hypothetical protein [Candidatus Lustribacter sp.]
EEPLAPAPAPAAAEPAKQEPAKPSGPTVTASGAVIPDFAEDARVIAQFEGARERFERAEAQAAEDEITADFRRRRELLQAEIATAQAVIDERQSKWEKALQAYGRRYPKLLDKKKALKPGFMANLLSFGSAGKMYQATVSASADLNDARSLRRRKEHDDEELDGLQRRALAKVDENQRAERQSGKHQEKFLARPGNAALAKRVKEIQDERAAYGARLAAGKVPPLEARDRAFQQLGALPLEAPFAGVAIVSIETYGDLCYLIFRDRERKHFYRPYDPRLEGLSDAVFDIYRIADRFEARLHKREGKPMSLSDHLTEFLRDDERAKSEARRIRALLREPRNPKPQETDKNLMDLLAELAKSAGRFAAG